MVSLASIIYIRIGITCTASIRNRTYLGERILVIDDILQEEGKESQTQCEEGSNCACRRTRAQAILDLL